MKIGVTGHQNIPRAARSYIREDIRRTIQKFESKTLVGLSSLAAGADQLFAEIILEIGAQLEVVIPCKEYESTFTPSELAHYQDLRGRAQAIKQLEFPQPSEDAYLAAGKYIVNNCDLIVAIWDGLPARGKGGTADIVKYAETLNRRVSRIWPAGLKR